MNPKNITMIYQYVIVKSLPTAGLYTRGFLLALVPLKGRLASSAIPRGKSGWATQAAPLRFYE